MYYVYTLTDPRDGLPFYVGKGSGGRMFNHAKRAAAGDLGAKCDRIRDILAAGLEVRTAVVAHYEAEVDAYEHEADLIACTSGLTNILAGYHGGLTLEECRRRQVLREERIAQRKMDTDKAWLREWLAKAESWAAVTFPGMKNGDEQATRFLSDVRALVAH